VSKWDSLPFSITPIPFLTNIIACLLCQYWKFNHAVNYFIYFTRDLRPVSILLGGLHPVSILLGGLRPVSILLGGLRPVSILLGGLRPVSILLGGLRPVSIWLGGLRPVSIWLGGLHPVSIWLGGLRPVSICSLSFHAGCLTGKQYIPIVFGLNRPGLDIRGEHANHYTTDAVPVYFMNNGEFAWGYL
jgi:hypothetical protein